MHMFLGMKSDILWVGYTVELTPYCRSCYYLILVSTCVYVLDSVYIYLISPFKICLCYDHESKWDTVGDLQSLTSIQTLSTELLLKLFPYCHKWQLFHFFRYVNNLSSHGFNIPIWIYTHIRYSVVLKIHPTFDLYFNSCLRCL